MRIVNVYNGDFIHSSQGGGMRYLRDLMQAQQRKGCEVELLAVGTGAARQIEIEGVPVWYVPVSPTLRWPRFLLGLFFYLLGNGERYRNAIVHLHRVYFALPFRLFARSAHIVATIHTKTFSVLTERFPLAEKILPLLLWLENLLLRTCVNRLSAAGDYAVNLYGERYGIERETIVSLCGPSLMRSSAVRDAALCDETRKNILCVGRLASVKRPLGVLALFVGAVRLKPELLHTHRLVFVGDGEDRAKLTAEVDRLGLAAHVKVLGSVEASRMAAIYAAGACLVLLSTSETGPFTVKEALACGLPVFATAVGNVVEYVAPECGVVIPVENPERQVERFVAFLESAFSPDQCKRQAENIFQKEKTLFELGLDVLYAPEHGRTA